jgi:hypothetical protein
VRGGGVTDLANLGADDFAPHVGTVFAIELADIGRVELELSSVAPAGGPDGRPFSLELRGPVEPSLPQRTYPLRHEALGTLEIFIVPVARDGDATTYEAVFA